MDTTVLSPSIVGQAEKAHGAVLRKVLAGTGLDEQQWITVQFAGAAGAGISRDDLIGGCRRRPSSIRGPWTRR